MGREFPVGESAVENHPFVSMSLFLASIAATIAIVSSLCGALSRKKATASSSSSGPENQIKENKDVNIPSPTSGDGGSPPEKVTTLTIPGSSSDSDNATKNEELSHQPLPPPPGFQHLSGSTSHHYRSNSTASSSSRQKKLPKTMSMRALGNGIGISSRQSSKRDQENAHDDYASKKRDKKLKHEDSIWKKTIILGEKCRVPDEDDDAIVYDEKGNRITTYHRKSTSMALSRQNSNTDPDAIPTTLEGQKDDILKIS